jgi:hypothetical protein
MIVILHILQNDPLGLLSTHYNEVVQGFLPDRPDKPLSISIHVGSTDRGANILDFKRPIIHRLLKVKEVAIELKLDLNLTTRIVQKLQIYEGELKLKVHQPLGPGTRLLIPESELEKIMAEADRLLRKRKKRSR